MKLRDLAQRLDAHLIGNGDHEVTGVAAIQEAGPHELAFLANRKYEKYLATTNAGALLLDQDVEGLRTNRLIHSKPYLAFANALTVFFPQPGSHLPAGIAPTAVIAETAEIADDVHVGNFVQISAGAKIRRGSKIMTGAFVGRNCVIAESCLIYPKVTIYDETIIGNNVTIHSGTVVGSDGYGYATDDGIHHKMRQVGRVRIEDDVEIGANCTIDRATLGETVIGAGTKIDNLVQIAHNVKIGHGCLIVSQVGISGSTRLGDYVVLAGQAGLVGHIEVGDRAVVGAQGGVPRSLKGGVIYAGSPVRELHEFKRVEAHVHRLPQKMERLRKLEQEVDVLRRELEELKSRT